MKPLKLVTDLLKSVLRSVRRRRLKVLSILCKEAGVSIHLCRTLRQALTHKSASAPEDVKGLLSNERLEFLGDAVLNCLVTEHLYLTNPDKSEGQLSKIKSLIVSRKILGQVALSLIWDLI